MRKGILIAAAVFAMLGAAVAAVSTQQHFRLQREGFENGSYCAISDKINCDIVNASSYSEFLTIPIAWWGFAFYLCIAGMSAFAAFTRKDARATVVAAWGMSVGGIIYSAWLAYIAFFVLEVICVECLAMYAVNIALVILLFFALRLPLGGIVRFFFDYAKAVFGRPSNLGFKPRVFKHAVSVGCVFLAAFLLMKGVQAKDRGEATEAPAKEKVEAFFMQSLHSVEPEKGWAVWGNPDAEVTIVEFSEYQCPFCRISAFNVKPHLQEFKKDVRYFFVNYPLDNACNDQMDRPMHPFACMAAKAAVCAQKRGDFWSFHDDLFRNQRGMDAETILGLAEKRGWDRGEFEACIDDPETDARVKAELAAGRKAFVTGTPTFYLNGRKLKYWRDPEFLQAVVKEEIKRSKKRRGTGL